VTVVIGVVTVTVVPVGTLTVAVVMGVLTVTVGIGSVGRETVGNGSFGLDSVCVTTSAVDETTDAGFASAPEEACAGARAALVLEPPPVLR